MSGALSRQWSSSTLVYGAKAVAEQPKGFLASKSDAELEAELAAYEGMMAAPPGMPASLAPPTGPTKPPQAAQTESLSARTEAVSTPSSNSGRSPSVEIVENRGGKGLWGSLNPEDWPDNQEGLETSPYAPTTVGTPAKTLTAGRAPSVASLASIDDTRHSRPQAGALHLSEAAIDQRLRRLMKPKANGEIKVSQDITEMYKKGGNSKKNVFHMFQDAGYDIETFKVEVEILKKEYTDTNTKIEAEFVSEAFMADEWGWSAKRIAAVVKFCESDPKKFMRRDRYENTCLYWAERRVSATLTIGNATEVNRRLAWDEKAAKSDFDLDIDDSNGFGNADKGNQRLLDESGNLPPQCSPTDPSEKMKKSLNVPELMDDAVPSTIAQKMVTCIEKRVGKLNDLHSKYVESGVGFSEIQNKLLAKLKDETTALTSYMAKITDMFANGIVEGFSDKDEQDLRAAYDDAVKKCIFTVGLEGRMRQVMPKVPSAKPGRSEGAPAGDGSKPPRKRAAEKAKAKASANKRTKK